MDIKAADRGGTEMNKDEARKIVEGAFGRRPDLPSGKDFVDEVRHGKPQPDHPSFEERWLEDEAAAKKSGLLTDEEIGDCLDLYIEKCYPCSDGSSVFTISVDALVSKSYKIGYEEGYRQCQGEFTKEQNTT